jgi:transketolase
LDTETLDLVIKKSKIIVTVEEHSVIGGLGSAISEYKTSIKNAPPQLILGLPDFFDITAEYRYLLERHGLVSEKIAQRTRNFLDRFN